MTDTSLAALRRAAERAIEAEAALARAPEDDTDAVRHAVREHLDATTAYEAAATPAALLAALAAARAEGIEEARAKVRAMADDEDATDGLGVPEVLDTLANDLALLAKGGAR